MILPEPYLLPITPAGLRVRCNQVRTVVGLGAGGTKRPFGHGAKKGDESWKGCYCEWVKLLNASVSAGASVMN